MRRDVADHDVRVAAFGVACPTWAAPVGGWHIVLGGDVRVNSFQCAPHSTCILPAPGVVGNVITADPGTGMGSVIFNVTASGPITANLLTGL